MRIEVCGGFDSSLWSFFLLFKRWRAKPASKTDLVCSRMGEGFERFGGELLGQKRTAGAEHRGVLPNGERLRRLSRALPGVRASGVPSMSGQSFDSRPIVRLSPSPVGRGLGRGPEREPTLIYVIPDKHGGWSKKYFALSFAPSPPLPLFQR